MSDPSKGSNDGPSTSRLLWVDGLLKLVQTLAVLAAGVWVLFQYLTYQREHQRVENATAALTYQQSEKDAIIKSVQAQYAGEQAKVKQQQDDLALKLGALDVTEKNVDLLLKQLQAQHAAEKEELNREQQRMAVKLSTLDVAQRSDEVALNDVKLQLAKSTRFNGEDTLEVSRIRDVDDASAEFEVVAGYTIKNISQRDLEVSAVIVQLFLAGVDVESHVSKTAPVAVIPIDLPPNLFNSGNRTVLDWRLIYSAAYMYGSAGPTTRSFLRQNSLQPRTGGAVTGLWRPDDGYNYHEYCIVRAPKRAILGCTQHVITNDGSEQYDYSYYSRNKKLWSDNGKVSK